MKKIVFLVVALLSVVSAKLYSSNQELVFEESPVLNSSGPPTDGFCMYRGGDDCSLGNLNGCAALLIDGKCNSDPPGAPQ